MSKKVSGIGMVLLVVVMAIALLLVARSWEAMAPTVLEVALPALSGEDTVSYGALEDPNSPDDQERLPGVNEMRRRTSAHENDVRDALQQIDGQQD